jgi:Brix domain
MEQNTGPRSFVLKTRNSDSLDPLLKDIQTLMLPNTASSLKQTKSNTLKDFTQVAGQYGITHFLILSQTQIGTNLRIARTPRGPTLSFSVSSYALIKDVQRIQRKPNAYSDKIFNESPLVVLNNMSGDAKHLKLMALMFQNMFPSIKVQTMQLSNAKRIILFNYTGEEETDASKPANRLNQVSFVETCLCKRAAVWRSDTTAYRSRTGLGCQSQSRVSSRTLRLLCNHTTTYQSLY